MDTQGYNKRCIRHRFRKEERLAGWEEGCSSEGGGGVVSEEVWVVGASRKRGKAAGVIGRACRSRGEVKFIAGGHATRI